jgi:hypothetical protein
MLAFGCAETGLRMCKSWYEATSTLFDVAGNATGTFRIEACGFEVCSDECDVTLTRQ